MQKRLKISPGNLSSTKINEFWLKIDTSLLYNHDYIEHMYTWMNSEVNSMQHLEGWRIKFVTNRMQVEWMSPLFPNLWTKTGRKTSWGIVGKYPSKEEYFGIRLCQIFGCPWLFWQTKLCWIISTTEWNTTEICF